MDKIGILDFGGQYTQLITWEGASTAPSQTHPQNRVAPAKPALERGRALSRALNG